MARCRAVSARGVLHRRGDDEVTHAPGGDVLGEAVDRRCESQVLAGSEPGQATASARASTQNSRFS